MPISITMELKTIKTIASTDPRRVLLNERLGLKLLYEKNLCRLYLLHYILHYRHDNSSFVLLLIGD